MNTFTGYKVEPREDDTLQLMQQWINYVERVFYDYQIIDFLRQLLRFPSDSNNQRVLTIPDVDQTIIDYLFSNLFIIFGEDQCIQNEIKIIIFADHSDFTHMIQFDDKCSVDSKPQHSPPSPFQFLHSLLSQ